MKAPPTTPPGGAGKLRLSHQCPHTSRGWPRWCSFNGQGNVVRVTRHRLGGHRLAALRPRRRCCGAPWARPGPPCRMFQAVDPVAFGLARINRVTVLVHNVQRAWLQSRARGRRWPRSHCHFPNPRAKTATRNQYPGNVAHFGIPHHPRDDRGQPAPPTPPFNLRFLLGEPRRAPVQQCARRAA